MHVTLLGYFQHLFAQFVCVHYRSNYTHTSEGVNWLCHGLRGYREEVIKKLSKDMIVSFSPTLSIKGQNSDPGGFENR